MNVIRLEEWDFGAVSDWEPPRIRGNVYGHPRFPDGTYVTPSSIVSFNPITEVFVTASGSQYHLGEPKREYVEMFPNARQRMVERLIEKFSNGLTNHGTAEEPTSDAGSDEHWEAGSDEYGESP